MDSLLTAHRRITGSRRGGRNGSMSANRNVPASPIPAAAPLFDYTHWRRAADVPHPIRRYRPHFDRPGGISRYTLRGIGVFSDSGIAGVNRANGIDFQSTAAALAALRNRDHLL